jgi:uncharacterized protein YecA (UPF0149 family)
MSKWPVGKYPEFGRNDPCPCQSGKKAKKCCLINVNTYFNEIH